MARRIAPRRQASLSARLRRPQPIRGTRGPSVVKPPLPIERMQWPKHKPFTLPQPTTKRRFALPPTPREAPKRPTRPTKPPVIQTPRGPKGTGGIPGPSMPPGYAPKVDQKQAALDAKQRALKTTADYFAGKVTKKQAQAAKNEAQRLVALYFGSQRRRGTRTRPTTGTRKTYPKPVGYQPSGGRWNKFTGKWEWPTPPPGMGNR